MTNVNIKSIIEKKVGKLVIQQDHLDDWTSWYEGNVGNFHNYRIYNGQTYVAHRRASLGMAKRVSEDWANLLFNEKTSILVKEQEDLDKILLKNNFRVFANEGIEKSFALGIGAFVESVDNLVVDKEGKITDISKSSVGIEFVNASKIYPFTFEDGNITECAFASVNTDNVKIAIHRKGRNGEYEITNIKVDSVGNQTSYTFKTKSTKPWFQIIKPNINNNVDINSPMGLSVFANSLDVLKTLDTVYDGYLVEFTLGKRRIFVNVKLTRIGSLDGEPVQVFDPNDIAFYVLPEDENSKQMIQTEAAALRTKDFNEALQFNLNLLSSKSGFGEKYYRFDSGTVATATQVVSENSTLYRTIKKHEIILESVLKNLIWAVMYISNNFTMRKFDLEQEIRIKFDDSIIEDKTSEMNRDLGLVGAGVMDVWEFRVKWFNETPEQAKAYQAEKESKKEKEQMRVSTGQQRGPNENRTNEPKKEEKKE